jgi:hypothetical protein
MYRSHARFKPGEEKTTYFRELGGDKANQHPGDEILLPRR